MPYEQISYEIADRDPSDPAWDNLAAEMGVTNYTRPYRYPPLTAELVAPLTALPPRAAASLWLVLSAVAAIVAAWWLALSLESRVFPHKLTGLGGVGSLG